MCPKAGVPDPIVYLSAGKPVCSLLFLRFQAKDYLLAGLADGTISVYDCERWQLCLSVKAFDNGILWMGSIKDSDLVFVQARFQGLQVYNLNTVRKEENRECLEFTKTAEFYIPHEGFCKGFVITANSDVYLFTPGQGARLGIHTFKQKFIRPLHSLNPEGLDSGHKYGAIMSCQLLSEERVLTGYENSEIILWLWKKNEVLARFPVPECGTLMSLSSGLTSLHNVVVVAGSENKVVVLKIVDAEFEVLKVHELTNPGISTMAMRPEKPILTTGGWDHRLRLFALIDSDAKPFKMKPLAVLDFHSEAVECLTLDLLSSGVNRNKWVTAAGSKDGKISIWVLYS